MIELYSWPTPNGQKIHIALEETGLPYKTIPVDISAGAQFSSEFLAINPNHRIPAIIDPDGPGGDVRLFESGAILIYLAEKAGNFIPTDAAGRYTCLQWLMFQMGGIGPMFGQFAHFNVYAPEKLPYAIERYRNESRRLVGVLETRLKQDDFLAGTYSIADMAAYPWVHVAAGKSFEWDAYPSVKRWHDAIEARPAVRRGMQLLSEYRKPGKMDEKMKDILFGKAQFERRQGN
jgi:GST-like protein